MSASNCTITNGEGTISAEGVQPHEARRLAQQMADEHGEPMFLSAAGGADLSDDDEDIGERFAPASYPAERDE